MIYVDTCTMWKFTIFGIDLFLDLTIFQLAEWETNLPSVLVEKIKKIARFEQNNE